jgi:hypothetical protein
MREMAQKFGAASLGIGVTLLACSATPPTEPFSRGASAMSVAPRRLPRGAARPRRADGTIEARADAAPALGAPVQKLIYFGGSVIAHVKVYAVNWGPNTNAAVKSGIGAFYKAITNSAYFDWLSEYSTIGVLAVDGSPGTAQRIGRGTFGGNFTIAPKRAATTLSDDDIQHELQEQIAAGHLPKPELDADGTVNSIYMFDFPAAITINLYNAGANATSCFEYGAYHSTTLVDGKSVPYGVHPDCGLTFEGATSVHSHELVEAVTDAEVGLVDPDLAKGETRPSAWYSFVNGDDQGESADLCEGSDTTVAGFTVQKIWSNSQGGCIGSSPTIVCEGAMPPVPGCRPCTAADEGVACNGARAHCQTDASSARVGQCVMCRRDADCPASAPVCSAASGGCVKKAACATNADCSGTAPVCDATTKTCRSCVAPDCSGATPACETSVANVNFGRCVACTTDVASACGAPTGVCDRFTNKCVACMSNADCSGTMPNCALPGRTCVR